jgi:hypothetical protein
MDAVTTAIIAAVEAGANSAAGDIAKTALADAYDGLKALLKKKFGDKSDVAEAVDRLDAKSADPGRRQSVEYELAAVNAGADPDLLAAAQALIAQIKSQQASGQHIQHVQGDFNAVADGGGSASVTIHGSVSKAK